MYWHAFCQNFVAQIITKTSSSSLAKWVYVDNRHITWQEGQFNFVLIEFLTEKSTVLKCNLNGTNFINHLWRPDSSFQIRLTQFENLCLYQHYLFKYSTKLIYNHFSNHLNSYDTNFDFIRGIINCLSDIISYKVFEIMQLVFYFSFGKFTTSILRAWPVIIWCAILCHINQICHLSIPWVTLLWTVRCNDNAINDN